MKPSPKAHLKVATRTHPGMTGKNNEDRFEVSSFTLDGADAKPAIFAVVADGIGGHHSGEVAAELAVHYIGDGVAKSNARNPKKILKAAIESASDAIASHTANEAEKKRMGSTCACAWIIGNELYAAHVGDSRIYLLRGANIRQLTKDHTWVVEALEKGIITPQQVHSHPNAHVIRRYLGSAELPNVDFRLYLDDNEKDDDAIENQGMELEAGDIVLLCTDGLTDLVWDDEIMQTIQSKPNLKFSADALINLANERGGHDNITVVLLRVPPSSESATTMRVRRDNWLRWLFGDEQ